MGYLSETSEIFLRPGVQVIEILGEVPCFTTFEWSETSVYDSPDLYTLREKGLISSVFLDSAAYGMLAAGIENRGAKMRRRDYDVEAALQEKDQRTQELIAMRDRGFKRAGVKAPKLNEMVMKALHELGGVQYLKELAMTQPKSFVTLLAKTMPTQLAGTGADGSAEALSVMVVKMTKEGLEAAEEGQGAAYRNGDTIDMQH